jgi:tartrate-resistant acid phosphatase type 5
MPFRLLGLLSTAACAAAAGDQLDYFVMADWGGQAGPPYSTLAERTTAAGMGKMAATVAPSFVLAVGDNFYSAGVTSVTDPRFKETFEDVFDAESLRSTPFYVIAGNHDHGGNVSAQIAYSEVSSRWRYPDSWYTFEKPLGSGGASIQFVMLDTVILSGNADVRDPATNELLSELDGDKLPGPADRALADTQMAWLEKTLNSSKATFLVVAGHYPVWSVCEHGPTSSLVQQLKPMLERFHVTAYIAGHDHCIEYGGRRSNPRDRGLGTSTQCGY